MAVRFRTPHYTNKACLSPCIAGADATIAQLLCMPLLLDSAPGLHGTQPLVWRTALEGLADASPAGLSAQLQNDEPGGRAAAASAMLGNLTQMAPIGLKVGACTRKTCICSSFSECHW